MERIGDLKHGELGAASRGQHLDKLGTTSRGKPLGKLGTTIQGQHFDELGLVVELLVQQHARDFLLAPEWERGSTYLTLLSRLIVVE